MSSSRRVKKGPGRRPQSAKRQRFMELRAQGWSIRAAGREVGISRSSARNWTRGQKVYRNGELCAAFSDHVWNELCAGLERSEESAAVILAGIARTDHQIVLTVNRVLWVPEDCYLERTPTKLKISSQGWMPALKAAEKDGLHPMFFHTHPDGDARPSALDDIVDSELSHTFSVRSGSGAYASIILGGDPEAPTFSGRAVVDGQPVPIVRARVVGRQIRIVHNIEDSGCVAAEHDVHQRQVLAFGAVGQEVLAGLRVGVIGAGGTGSAVIEQLTRLGIRDITVVDDDVLARSNVSRVYGPSVGQAGELLHCIRGRWRDRSSAVRARSGYYLFTETEQQPRVTARPLPDRLPRFKQSPDPSCGVEMISACQAVRISSLRGLCWRRSIGSRGCPFTGTQPWRGYRSGPHSFWCRHSRGTPWRSHEMPAPR